MPRLKFLTDSIDLTSDVRVILVPQIDRELWGGRVRVANLEMAKWLSNVIGHFVSYDSHTHAPTREYVE